MKNSFYTSFPAFAPIALLFLMSLGQLNLSEKNILGHWTYEGANKEEVRKYKAQKQFVKSESGIAFMKDGKLLVRQNSGWCGTPPVSYRNYEGTWKWVGKENIELNYPFWGGMIKEEWNIISADKNNLSIKSISYETIKRPRDKK